VVSKLEDVDRTENQVENINYQNQGTFKIAVQKSYYYMLI